MVSFDKGFIAGGSSGPLHAASMPTHNPARPMVVNDFRMSPDCPYPLRSAPGSTASVFRFAFVNRPLRLNYRQNEASRETAARPARAG